MDIVRTFATIGNMSIGVGEWAGGGRNVFGWIPEV